MSAIAGILSLDRGPADVDAVEGMVAAMRRRGPDDDGSYRSPGCHFAMAACRRSLLDRSAAASLPMANETHDVWLALDGEIYNHRLLRHGLELDGHRFRSNSDAEAVLHAYEQYGLGFIDNLQGEFVLALWDDRLDRLVVARDRLGRKPLYYAERSTKLVFASAIAPLMKVSGLPGLLDPQALAQFLACGHVAAPSTLVAGVSKLAAGEMLVADRDGPPYRVRWSRLPTDGRRAAALRAHGAERHVGNLRTLIECSIADRLMGDAPVGALVGPGLDGGVGAMIMARLSGRVVPTVTVIDESDRDGAAARDARLLGRAAGSHAHEIAVSAEACAAALPEVVAALGEPLGNPASLLWWWGGRGCAEAGLAAVQAGEGNDEVMLGHPAYGNGRCSGLGWELRRLLARLTLRRPPESGLAARLAPVESGWPTLLGPVAGGVSHPPRDSTADHCRPADLPDWLSSDPLAAAGWLDLTGRVAESACLRVDFMAMAHGVSVRLPYLDDALVSYALAVPGRQRSPAGAPKQLWRRAVADLLPAELASRAVTPVTLPLDRWLSTGPLAAELERCIAGSALFLHGVLAAAPARALLSGQWAGGGRTRLLWSLLVLARWSEALGLTGLAARGEEDWIGLSSSLPPSPAGEMMK
jgi:asparagine synthase (glutamine-hydrolysing)